MKTAAQLEELAAWLAATDIALLELRMPDGTVRLGRDADAPGRTVPPQARRAGAATIAAPSVGEFLLGHPLGDARLVRIGERVTQGQPLGLLRVGPLLLRVDAPRAGVIAAVRAAHGDLVGYGAALFDLRAT